MNYFEELNKVDVSEHIEKKGQFNYLSWAWAIEQLGKLHPEAKIETKVGENGFPAFFSPTGQSMVWVTVEIEGVVRGQPYPVLDFKNKAIVNADVFQINTALQRALVKAISLHGLGLYIYAGEDLPHDAPTYTKESKELFDQYIDEDNALGLFLLMSSLPVKVQTELHNSFKSGEITKMKKKVRSLEGEGSKLFKVYTDEITLAISEGDSGRLQELGDEVGNEAKVRIFNALSADLQKTARELAENT